MAITTALCTVAKKAFMDGELDFSSDTAQVFKVALYTSSATLNATTTAYSSTNEVPNGSGYTTGGATLVISVNPTISGSTVYIDFSDVTWAAASFTARGALVYKSGGGNPAIATLDFGEDKTASAGNFVLQWPTADASNAIIRLS